MSISASNAPPGAMLDLADVHLELRSAAGMVNILKGISLFTAYCIPSTGRLVVRCVR
jgi:hypothetical protein